MSITLGDAVLFLRTDDSKLDSGLNAAEQKTKGFLGSIGGVATSALSFATEGLVVSGINAITGSIGGLASDMINSNAAFEQYETRFAVMLGSTEAAQQRMQELADFGANTPFDLPGVVEADTILQGFGLHSEESAKKFGFAGDEIRTIAGDVASGTGSSFQEMSLLIGKFSAGATGEAISRMQELGITNRDELTKMGLEFSKSGELLSPLPESMNVILSLMQDKYGGLMDAQSKTFDGMMSNLRDWTDNAIRTVGQPIFEVLEDRLGDLLEFLGSPMVQQSITMFADFLADGIGVAIDWINEVALPALQEFGTWFINEGWPAIQAFMEPVLAQLIPGLEQIWIWVSQLAQIALPILAAAWEWVTNNLNIVLPILGVVGVAILAIQAPILLVIGAIVLLATAWANNWGGIQDKTQAVLDFIVPLIQGAMDLIQSIVSTVLDAISAWWQAHGDSVMTIVNAVWSFVAEYITTQINLIYMVIMMVAGAILAFWNTWGDEIMLVASLVWDNIKTIVKAAMEIIGFTIDAISALISGDWQAFGDALQGIWRTAWDAISTIISNAKTTLLLIVQDIIDSIMTEFEGLVNDMVAIGEAIVDSIIEGIESGWISLTNLITSLIGSLSDSIYNALGIGNVGRFSAQNLFSDDQNTFNDQDPFGGWRPPPPSPMRQNNQQYHFTQNIYTNTGPGNTAGEFQQGRALLST